MQAPVVSASPSPTQETALEAQLSALQRSLSEEFSKLLGLAAEQRVTIRRVSNENEQLRVSQTLSEGTQAPPEPRVPPQPPQLKPSASGDAGGGPTDFLPLLPQPPPGWPYRAVRDADRMDSEVLSEVDIGSSVPPDTVRRLHPGSVGGNLLSTPSTSQMITIVPGHSNTDNLDVRAAERPREGRHAKASHVGSTLKRISQQCRRINAATGRVHNGGDLIHRIDPPLSATSSDEAEFQPQVSDRSVRSRRAAAHAGTMSPGASSNSLEQLRTASLFGGPVSTKDKVRMAVLQEEYNVHDYYWQKGVWQVIARSSTFEHVTLLVIGLNALWIAIDSDMNSSPLVVTSDVGFQIVEHFFCLYFVFEWACRFMAFKRKVNCLKDSWFVFDTALALLMVVETWVLTLIFLVIGVTSPAGFANVSVLKVLRLLRMTRMARMAKLLTAMPELMILIKGITGAARSVFFTLCLLCSIVYVFAIAFRQLTEGTDIGDRYFPNFFEAWNTLLIRGTLPDLADLVNELARDDALNGFLILLFILLATLMLMNMLVGVLVEVVSKVSVVEREQLEATFLKNHMQELLERSDNNHDNMISKEEFETLLEMPKAIKALQEVGVDVIGLAEIGDFLFRDTPDMTFPDFMECILQLRGSNLATVKSIVDLRMFMTLELAALEDSLLEKISKMLLQKAWPHELSNPGDQLV